MKKRLIATAVLALVGTSAAFGQVDPLKGGSSNINNVEVGLSDLSYAPLIAPLGYAGISMKRNDGNFSKVIPLRTPVSIVTAFASDGGSGKYVAGIPLIMPNIAQVWWKSDPTGTGAANVYSLRQLQYPAASEWPHFGGLVIGRVIGTGNTNGVYFGEWSPAVPGTPTTSDSRNLNMTDGNRTVWYVGDNPVTSMPTKINATYNVVGISQTGTNSLGATLPGGLPHNPNLYSGTLDVSYSSGSGGTIGAGSTNNSISRVVGGATHTISFAGTTISSNGTFTNSATTNAINGRFYNSAEALAGIYTNGTYADAAFGGSKVSGTINP